MQNFILCLVTGTELKAAKELEAIGIRTVCPMRPTTRRSPQNRRKVETISVPVLPGYIVMTASQIDWPAIRKLKEVVGPIEIGGVPQQITQETVDYIAALDGIEAAELPFALNQRVQVLDDMGRPTGMYGTIAKLFGIKKAELELDRLGTATIDTGKLEVA